MTSEELYRLPIDVRYQGKVCMRLFNDTYRKNFEAEYPVKHLKEYSVYAGDTK